MDPRAMGIIGLAIALVIAGIMFSQPIDSVEESEIYYTSEPVAFEKIIQKETQVPRFLIFGEATEIQYIIRNADSVDGEFTLSFVFNNGQDIKSSTKKVKILAGAKEAVTQVSPLGGVSTVTLDVTASNKLVAHQRTVTREITTWDKLGGLIPIIRWFR